MASARGINALEDAAVAALDDDKALEPDVPASARSFVEGRRRPIVGGKVDFRMPKGARLLTGVSPKGERSDYIGRIGLLAPASHASQEEPPQERTLTHRIAKSRMKYGWRSFTFDLPPGLEDESVLTFLALRDETVSFNVTLSRAELEGGFEAYLTEAIEDLRRSLGSYRLVAQRGRKVAGLDARVLEQTATSPDGERLAQLQAYIANGKEVLIVTATGRVAEKDELQKAFDHILGSLRLSPA